MQQLLRRNLIRPMLPALERRYLHLSQEKPSPFPSLSPRSICPCGKSIFCDSHCFLRINDFSIPQITELDTKIAAPFKLKNNISFFRSKGLSGRQIYKVICSCPALLTISLENQIVPAYDALKSFFQSDSNTVAVIKNCPQFLLLNNVDALLVRNCNILYGCGVPPQSNVAVKLLTASPWIISMGANDLKQVVERLRDEMGFDPSKYNFREALGVVTHPKLTCSQWECKLDVIKKWGLSEEQVIAGFRRFPKLMTMPDEKINSVIEPLVNCFAWKSSDIIVTYPKLLAYSYHRRIEPRITVLLHRVRRNLMKREDVTPALFMLNDKCFLHKCFPHDAPGLLILFPKRIRESVIHDRETDVGKGRARLTIDA